LLLGKHRFGGNEFDRTGNLGQKFHTKLSKQKKSDPPEGAQVYFELELN
jgi:hypothetical protein